MKSHCRRELFQAIWRLLLDDEFDVDVWEGDEVIVEAASFNPEVILDATVGAGVAKDRFARLRSPIAMGSN